MSNFMRDAALAYAAKGKPVFPCTCEKKPITKGGFKDASTDPELIDSWWTKTPGASIGIPTGAAAGFFVLDIDLPDGPATLTRLEQEHGPLPATLEQRTGSGGRHLFFKMPDKVTVKNSAGKLGHNLDIRGDGGYVILAPSSHPSGNPYAFINKLPPAEAPAWLLERIIERPKTKAPTPHSGGLSEYGRNALARELSELTGCREGERNARLNQAAFSLGQLVAGGELAHGQAEAALLSAAIAIGLPEVEARRTIASGMEAGTREPRTTPTLKKAEEWEPTSPDWPVMDSKAYHGLTADFIDLATRSSEADPAAILATFLVRFGVECGPGPFMQVGDSRHWVRLASVIVGASSKARKGTSSKPVKKLFNFAQMEGLNSWMMARESSGPFSSGEGIVYAIRDAVKRWNQQDKIYEIVDPGVEDKRLFVLDEEFGGVLANTKREGNTLSMIIRSAHDSGNFDPLTKNNKTTATNGHIGWVSHITFHELHTKLDDSEGFNGFANRILWVCAKRQKLVALPEPMPQKELAAMQVELGDILRGIGEGTEIKLGPQAKEAWRDQYYAELTKDRPGLVGSVTNRGEAQALRLAMIYCLLDGQSIVRLSHLEAGLAFWDYCRQSANYIFYGRRTDNTARTILEALKKGTPMTGTEIHGLFGNHANKQKLERALYELIVSTQVVFEKRKNFKGAPTRIYRFNETLCEFNELNELNSKVIEGTPIKLANSLNSQEHVTKLEVFDI